MKNGVIVESIKGKDGCVTLEHEDAGHALIGDLQFGPAVVVKDGVATPEPGASVEEGFFVILQSWTDARNEGEHAALKSLEGKRVRVTVEVLED